MFKVPTFLLVVISSRILISIPKAHRWATMSYS